MEETISVGTATRQQPLPARGERGRSLVRYVAEFERFDQAAASHQPAWLIEARHAAIARFSELGFPSTHDEQWRFTSVAPLAERTTVPAGDDSSSISVETFRQFGLDGASGVVVLVNGRFAPHLSMVSSLPTGVVVSSLRAALESHAAPVEAHLTRIADHVNQPFVALNTAFLEDGVFVSIAPHTVLAGPIHLVLVSTGRTDATTATYPRVLVVGGEHSQAQIV